MMSQANCGNEFDLRGSTRSHRAVAGSLRLLLAVLIVMSGSTGWAREVTLAALAPGVVVDGQDQRVFLLESEGLTARDFDTGQQIWRLGTQIEPLGIQAGQLIALRVSIESEQVELLQIDTATGRITETNDLTFPASVRVRIGERPGERFQAQLLQDSDAILLRWDFVRHPLQGAPAISGVSRPPKMPGESSPADGQSGSQTGSAMAEHQGLSERHGGLIEIAGSLGDRRVAYSEVIADDGRVSHWQSLSADARLAGHPGRQFRRSDGEAVLASQRLESEHAFASYRWTVLDAAGQRVGSYVSPYAFAPFTLADGLLAYVAQPWVRVDGERLIDVQSLALVVVDLANGREAWQAALFDKTWREGMPP